MLYLRLQLCYTEKATKARHRQERQKQRHNQNHQQTNQATPKQPTNNTTNLCTKHPTHHTHCSCAMMYSAAGQLCCFRHLLPHVQLLVLFALPVASAGGNGLSMASGCGWRHNHAWLAQPHLHASNASHLVTFACLLNFRQHPCCSTTANTLDRYWYLASWLLYGQPVMLRLVLFGLDHMIRLGFRGPDQPYVHHSSIMFQSLRSMCLFCVCMYRQDAVSCGHRLTAAPALRLFVKLYIPHA